MDLGQHFVIGIPNANPDDKFINFIKDYKIAGVLFLGKNYDSIDLLIDTVNKIQDTSNDLALFTSVDHEGGRVQRFKAPFTVLPSLRNLSQNKSPKQIYDISINVAQQLLACGINYNLAPVADMTDKVDGVIGDRSVGTDLDTVDKFITPIIRGYVKANLMCCVKHFPGHGCVQEDSHEILPVSDKTLQQLLEYEVIPFKKAIKAGAHSIMPAHILFKNIDSLPSSLSPVFVKDLIRNELRYKKIIISDDISMGAITKSFTPQEATLLAFKAGIDLIIYSSFDIDHLANLIDTTIGIIEKDSELKSQVQESQIRIKQARQFLSKKLINPQVALQELLKSGGIC